MKYRDSSTDLPTSTKILKVNHAGEFGAVNIYRSQSLRCVISLLTEVIIRFGMR